MLAGSADPIFASDAAGRLALVNDPAARAFDIEASSALGRRLSDLASPSTSAVEETTREVLRTGAAQSIEFELPEPQGDQVRSFVATVAPWRGERGEVTVVVCVARDVTHRRRVEARIRAMQAELLHVSRLTEMGAVASAMAHELNQPLTACANFTNAARRMLSVGAALNQESLDEALLAMEEAAEQAVLAGQIVRRMRAFLTRGDSEKQLAELNAVVRDAAALALVDARQRGVTVRFHFDPANPCALCDRVQVQQVLVNLMRNAVEAMRDETRRELTVSSRAIGTELVEISVADTGAGVQVDVAGRLFEPFVSTKPGGMGVGLWICRSIVEEHGGTLSVGANPGGGTIFRFTLPAVPHRGNDADAV